MPLKLSQILLFVAIAALPIYVLPLGNLQPFHYLIIAYCGLYILMHGIGRGLADGILVFLIAIILIRESVAVAGGAPMSSFLPAAHVLYALIVFNVFRRALVEPENQAVLRYALLVAATIAILGVFIFGFTLLYDAYEERPVGTFRNANQVGYFAVCIFSLAFFFRLRNQLSALVLVGLILISFFLAIVSLSKAAMIGIAVASTFAGLALATRRSFVIIGCAVVAVLFLVAFSQYTSGALDDFAFVQRLEGIGSENDDSLASRGYGLFFEGNSWTMLFGHGSAEIIKREEHEVHSTIFSFFVNYGLVGGFVFSAFMFLWARRIWRLFGATGLLLIVAPVMLYGITHNGSRFVILWILLSLSFSIRAKSEGRDFRQWSIPATGYS